MRFFKAGAPARTPEDEAALMRLMAIADRLRLRDAIQTDVETEADGTSSETEPDTLQ